MVKVSSQFICQQCGYSQVGWAGKCPECGEWNSLVETITQPESKRAIDYQLNRSASNSVLLSSVTGSALKRLPTGISELDRTLGGGIVPGQVILLAGEPGIGKSTILLEMADKMDNILYVTGEESVGQVAIRARRMGLKHKRTRVLESTDVDAIVAAVATLQASSCKGVVVDSIQTMQTMDLSGMAGSVGQVRECAYRLIRMAKSRGTPVFMVGHVTKEGAVAGPAILTHLVDTVLWFEGDRLSSLRLLRAVKNRFGPTDEVGIFEMVEKGLVGITNPETVFLSEEKHIPGSCVSCLLQGSRPLLVEVQSLVVPTRMAFPKRVAQGISNSKLEMLLAVLIRRCGLPLYEQDVFVNIAGGIKVTEPAVDLAVCLSIASALFDKAIPAGTTAVGEVGLLGEIRKVTGEEKRAKEARRLGYRHILTSKSHRYLNTTLQSLR